jgi:hypothetical protein
MSNIQRQTNAKLDTLNATMNGMAETSNMIGNTSADGSGTHNHLHIDANGIAKVQAVNTINIAPADSSNAELTPTKSFNVKNANITKGNAATSAGAEMQQVLIYGKKDDTTLQPLECSGDRLLVDVVELAQSGQITTSTALSATQVCGFDTSTSKFKTIAVDTNGNQSVNQTITKTGSEITLDKDDLALSGSLATGNQTKWVDVSSARSIRVVCKGLTSAIIPTTLGLEGSQTTALSDFELIDEKSSSTALSGIEHINFKLLDCPYKYVRLRNDSGSAISFTKLNVNTIN